MSDFEWLILMSILLVLFILSGTWHRIPTWLTMSPPNITLLELAELLPPDEEVILNWDPPKKIPGAVSAQIIKAPRTSVIYHKTDHGHTLVETIDISAWPKAGIILTLRDGEIAEYQRIGAHWSRNPRVTSEEQQSITALLRRVRELVKDSPNI